MSTRAVIFDFYGTLAEAVRWGPGLFDVAAALGYDCDPGVQTWWHPERWDGIDHREHSGTAEAYRAWERSHRVEVLSEAGLSPTQIHEVLSQWEPAALDYELAPYPETRATLQQLRAAGLTVAVCSNWGWELDQALEAVGVHDLADVAVTSARAGVRKPHPHIFEHTLAQVACEATDVLFVGDSWGPDVEGPIAHGMRAAHVWRDDDEFRRSRTAPPEPPHPEGVHQISTLDEVLQLI